METRGPSPLVPFLMLNVFAIIIFSPMVENLVVIPFLLMLVIYFIYVFFPFHQDSSWTPNYHGGVGASAGAGANEGDSGFGFGAFLLCCRVYANLGMK
ncbi:hypothetical protein L1987_28754 [Smallanthus sonchifolius]|uniref:Uncharacterized protein n=1 Tax=Smallanthus sonchifolius TaxID=185202 RepID=A0ACB9HZW6_9ASTR|nr:hypothetical protein L1987_28754 [Smallanthus sonchifolius]